MFATREDAGRRLAQLLKDVPLIDPLILAIPRGGIETGAALARELHAELDIVLSRKLRSKEQPELAMGAISEDGQVYLNQHSADLDRGHEDYLAVEREHQRAEIDRRRKLFRALRPAAGMTGRSVIVTDDGIATGSTMIAALRTVRGQNPHELIVAVPVAPPDQLETIRALCDRLVCLHSPSLFWAIGQFYDNFEQVSDERVTALLKEFQRPAGAAVIRSPVPVPR